MELSGKRITLGVTGGIAAYKAAELVRLQVKLGATVRVVMTEAATRFVTPVTFQALSGNLVFFWFRGGEPDNLFVYPYAVTVNRTFQYQAVERPATTQCHIHLSR